MEKERVYYRCFAFLLSLLLGTLYHSPGVFAKKGHKGHVEVEVLSDGGLGGDVRLVNRLLDKGLGRGIGTVIVTSTTVGLVPLAANLLHTLENSLHPSPGRKKVVLVLSLDGRKTCNILDSVAAIHAPQLTDSGAVLCVSARNTRGEEVYGIKEIPVVLSIIAHVVGLGHDGMYVDADSVVLTDPLPHLNSRHLTGADVVVMAEEITNSLGFFLARPHKGVVEWLQNTGKDLGRQWVPHASIRNLLLTHGQDHVVWAEAHPLAFQRGYPGILACCPELEWARDMEGLELSLVTGGGSCSGGTHMGTISDLQCKREFWAKEDMWFFGNGGDAQEHHSWAGSDAGGRDEGQSWVEGEVPIAVARMAAQECWLLDGSGIFQRDSLIGVFETTLPLDDKQGEGNGVLGVASVDVDFAVRNLEEVGPGWPGVVDVDLTLKVSIPLAVSALADPLGVTAFAESLSEVEVAGEEQSEEALASIAVAAVSNLAVIQQQIGVGGLSAVQIDVVMAFGGHGAWHHIDSTTVSLMRTNEDSLEVPSHLTESKVLTTLSGSLVWHPGALWWLLDGSIVAKVRIFEHSTGSSKTGPLLGEATLCKYSGWTKTEVPSRLKTDLVQYKDLRGNSLFPMLGVLPIAFEPSDPWLVSVVEEDERVYDGTSYSTFINLGRLSEWKPQTRQQQRDRHPRQQSQRGTRGKQQGTGGAQWGPAHGRQERHHGARPKEGMCANLLEAVQEIFGTIRGLFSRTANVFWHQ
ncbi:unnamed protein product [Choristocarpus tenellus]